MPTEKQKEIAQLLQIDISKSSTRVAAAQIEDCVYLAIHPDNEKYDASEEQISYANSLGVNTKNDSRNVISAQIADELERRNVEAINSMSLKHGDTVTINDHEYIISSIGKNYRLWFKGGQGHGAWPTQVQKKEKTG